MEQATGSKFFPIRDASVTWCCGPCSLPCQNWHMLPWGLAYRFPTSNHIISSSVHTLPTKPAHNPMVGVQLFATKQVVQFRGGEERGWVSTNQRQMANHVPRRYFHMAMRVRARARVCVCVCVCVSVCVCACVCVLKKLATARN